MTHPVEHLPDTRDVLLCESCSDWVRHDLSHGVAVDSPCERHVEHCDRCWGQHYHKLRQRSEDIVNNTAGAVVPERDDLVILRLIHESCMSVVFKAILIENGRRRLVALKCVRHLVPDAVLRFGLEYNILSRSTLDCPVLPRFLGPCETETTIDGELRPTYILTEWVNGCPLDMHPAWLAGAREGLKLVERVCDAVGDLHEHGIVHRDLKPSNVLITNRGVKILDLGVAKWLHSTDPRITQAGNMSPGTTRYMAPEQFDRNHYEIISPTTDIWALGIIMFELLTGRHPLVNDGVLGFKERPQDYQTGALHKEPRLNVLGTGCPVCCQTLEIALARNPYDRYASGRDMARAVAGCADAESKTVRSTRRWQGLRRCPVRIPIFHVALRSALATMVGGIAALGLALFGAGWLAKPTLPGGTAGITPENLELTRKQIHVFEIDDNARDDFPEYAVRHDLPGVTRDRSTWRPVCAHVLRKLEVAQPRAVIFDLVFEANREHDDMLRDAILKLASSGVPVVLGAKTFQSDQLLLAERVHEALGSMVSHGLIFASSQKHFPGEYVLAARLSEQWQPSLFLAAYAAILRPGSPPLLSYDKQQQVLDIDFESSMGLASSRRSHWYGGGHHRLHIANRRPYATGNRLPLFTPLLFGAADPEDGPRATRIEGIKVLLSANSEQIESRYRDKVIIIGDTQRRPRFAARLSVNTAQGPGDWHDRGGGRKVAGVYVVADAVANLLAGRYEVRLFREDYWASLTCMAAILIGALLGLGYYRVHAFALFRKPWIRYVIVACVVAVAALAVRGSLLPHGRLGAHVLAGAVCFSATLLASMALISGSQHGRYRRVRRLAAQAHAAVDR